ncbi:hypothetical protein PVAG01_09866 [Phlyctema vagabunda]|uniref:Uncharacterized protein n=1 Tax=Phlyctema vagabunda TaxID=108571 RepID=A0ABR4P4D2_9HELO
MSSPKIDLKSYVDIAASMALPDSEPKHRERYVPRPRKQTKKQPTSFSWDSEGHEINDPALLKAVWKERIEYWQELLPSKGSSIEECENLNELQFSTLFFQYPFAAMSLWNVMQAFYALDRLCCGSYDSLKWESMPPFQYLEANKVERLWKCSLQSLGNGIKYSSNGANLVQRMHDIFSGIQKFENAQSELKRNLISNLKDVKLVEKMLEKIDTASKKRFSMINTYLEVARDNGDSKDITHKQYEGHDFLVGHKDNSSSKEMKSIDKDPIRLRALKRSNSIDVLKRQSNYLLPT